MVKEELIRVPEGHCWVQGDNLEWSRDSRLYGPLPLGLIKSKVLAVVMPLRDAKWVGSKTDLVDPVGKERESGKNNTDHLERGVVPQTSVNIAKTTTIQSCHPLIARSLGVVNGIHVVDESLVIETILLFVIFKILTIFLKSGSHGLQLEFYTMLYLKHAIEMRGILTIETIWPSKFKQTLDLKI
ncbi:hypothetical protein PTRG_09985 [Pyrenophora tritici-repentis Pt-1C-BFP]|uniref:Peptidase S26 domain-containing protein n=1 Tax=Pyrenophora tritici-repentis (strain Pt-1C-BFP) TaxID=426418 RepID=B2WJ26_PYRTR|nr:uncharacterized protein PTRG_09985 [Pyrenophora tritici-repentis Pt-1C-BFP]EDU43036.1 hypothetical protein PTRG_09985 [Pyrenophora tritici-repentis Pt-1C-BFP]